MRVLLVLAVLLAAPVCRAEEPSRPMAEVVKEVCPTSNHDVRCVQFFLRATRMIIEEARGNHLAEPVNSCFLTHEKEIQSGATVAWLANMTSGLIHDDDLKHITFGQLMIQMLSFRYCRAGV